MVDVAGIINLAEPAKALGKLTLHRTLGAVPFGGRYRLIDFTLSNLVNAGIRNVGILIADFFGPLLDHIKDGKAWDLDRQKDGLFLLQPAPQQPLNEIQNLYYNRLYLKKSRQKFVLLTGSNVVANLDYKQVLAFHRQKKADLTIISCRRQLNPPVISLAVDENGRVFQIKLGQKGPYYSLNMYLLEKGLLSGIVEACASENKGSFLMDGILPNLGDLKVYAFGHPGYVGLINSVLSYHQHSLELLNLSIWAELFSAHGQIHTKVKHEAPAHYFPGSRVLNSLIATGCTILGAVENSILFRGVAIGPGATVKNSIVLQKSCIQEGAFLQNAILDKDVTVFPHRGLRGRPDCPLVVAKSEVLRGREG